MDIIMIPFHDYRKWEIEGYRTRDAHLFQHFCRNAEVNKILVINRPISLAEAVINGRKFGQISGKRIFKEDGAVLIETEPDVWCLDFFVWDFWKVLAEQKKWWFSVFCYEKVQKGIKKAVDVLGMKHPVIFLQNPMAVPAADLIDQSLFVFDAIDNWLYHPQMNCCAEQVERNYCYIREYADCIFTVSNALKDFFDRPRRTVWIPNGVDRSYFQTASNHVYQKRPVIGYVGKIQERVDFQLLELCLNAYPESLFQILGPIYGQKKAASYLKSRYRNVEFKGDIHYDELPEAMQMFDIAIIPHKIDSFTESMNPLKLYEYLAAGKPVVSTAVAGTGSISEYVYLADNAEMFVQKLGWLIERAKKGLINGQVIAESLSDTCSWESRIETILDVLDEELEKKASNENWVRNSSL